jgi:hypothetical protein
VAGRGGAEAAVVKGTVVVVVVAGRAKGVRHPAPRARKPKLSPAARESTNAAEADARADDEASSA